MAVRPSKNWPLQHEASDSVSRHALALTLTPTPPPARNTRTTNCCCCCSEPLLPWPAWPCPWLWPSPLTLELWPLTLTTVAEPRAETQLAIWLSTILALGRCWGLDNDDLLWEVRRELFQVSSCSQSQVISVLLCYGFQQSDPIRHEPLREVFPRQPSQRRHRRASQKTLILHPAKQGLEYLLSSGLLTGKSEMLQNNGQQLISRIPAKMLRTSRPSGSRRSPGA